MNQIYRLPTVLAITGASRSRLYAHIHQGLFPKPVKLGLRAAGWPEDEIQTVIQARIAGKSHDDICALVKKLEEARKTGVSL